MSASTADSSPTFEAGVRLLMVFAGIAQLLIWAIALPINGWAVKAAVVVTIGAATGVGGGGGLSPVSKIRIRIRSAGWADLHRVG